MYWILWMADMVCDVPQEKQHWHSQNIIPNIPSSINGKQGNVRLR